MSSQRGISGGIGKGGGVSKSGGYRRSRGSGGSSYRHGYGSSSSGTKKMPLWQAILLLLVLGGLAVWGIVKLVHKVRRAIDN
ncbi:hypothetical protein [Streptomyces alanosinicus]|uniref:hypothetical protein n=1 Tax=Streptomyces alanosinicus TaxID=68171 RepID=UPI0016767365|nr:hypothetical protein [Streptomyces alanosinicus]